MSVDGYGNVSDDDFESMFDAEKMKRTPKSKVEAMVQNIENEFDGVKKETTDVAQKSRDEEKKSLKEKITALKKLAAKHRNAKNARCIAANQRMFEAREKYRSQIKILEDKLAVIDQEEMGAKIDPVSMVKAEKEKKIRDAYTSVTSLAENKVKGWDDLL